MDIYIVLIFIENMILIQCHIEPNNKLLYKI